MLELYGLVSFIDEHVFGDIKSFREQFANLSQEQAFLASKARLRSVCHRTLRRQVLPYFAFAIGAIAASTADVMKITLNATSPKRNYTFCKSANLGVSGAWTPVTGPVTETDGALIFHDSISAARGFYRVEVSIPLPGASCPLIRQAVRCGRPLTCT